MDNLTSQLKAGDPEAFAEIMNAYSPHVRSLARRWMGNGADADDITQEVFLRVWRFAHTFRKEVGSLKGWLLQITANVMKEEFRKRAHHIFPVDTDPETWAELHPGEKSLRDRRPDPYSLALNSERLNAIKRAVKKVSAKDGRAAVLRHVEGLSTAEIADRIGVSVPAAKSKTHRGKVALKVALKKWRAA